jgi:hypothetical protein
MALVDNAWYVNFGNGSSTGYYAVTAWATGTVIAAGALRRQLAAPAVGSERVFVCIVAGTTHATTEPTWVITRGGKTTDNTVTWQECTGIAALNGDATNTPSWTITATPPGGVKNTAVTLGQVIKRDNGASYQICTTAGTAGNSTEPAFSDTAGTTKADNTVTWTSLGVVGNFTGWQAPHARLASAFTTNWGQAGNSFFVASAHAETQASAITLSNVGTAAAPCLVYCVTTSTVPPVSTNLTTGASITTTGSGGASGILAIRAYTYYYGVTFQCGGSPAAQQFIECNGGGAGLLILDTCALVQTSTATASNIGIGATGGNSRTIWNNTTVQFSNASQAISVVRGSALWKNTPTAIVSGTLPTTLIAMAPASYGGRFVIDGVDLSALGSGKTLVGASLYAQYQEFQLVNCKLGASVTVSSTPPGQGGATVDLIRCDSGAVNYRSERYWYQGTQTVETTIVRTGGATDGTTPISWKLVTTANSKWISPFESQPISIWNDTTGSAITVTIYGIWGGGAVPNTDDIWIEAEYLGSSATPLGSFINSTKANNLATGSALTSDTSTWGGSTTKFKMSVTFTPQMKGPINIVVKAAKVSTTFYIDPKPEIASTMVTKSYATGSAFVNEIASRSPPALVIGI